MRATWIMALVLLGAEIGTAGAEQLHVRPDKAALACMARVDREIERRNLGQARPIGRFETMRVEGGWRVYGLYLAQEGLNTRRLRIACAISPALVEVTTIEPAE